MSKRFIIVYENKVFRDIPDTAAGPRGGNARNNMDTNLGDDAFDSALIPFGREDDEDDNDGNVDGLPASAQQPFTPSPTSPLSAEQQQREQQQQQQRWQQRWQQDTGVPPPSSFPSPTTTTNPEILEASPARTPPPRSPTPDGRGQLKNIHLEQKFNEVFGELEGVVTDFKDFVRQGLLELLGDMKHEEDVGDQLAAEQTSLMQRNQDELEALHDDWRRANAELESVFN